MFSRNLYFVREDERGGRKNVRGGFAVTATTGENEEEEADNKCLGHLLQAE